jgi:hypothetical protein
MSSDLRYDKDIKVEYTAKTPESRDYGVLKWGLTRVILPTFSYDHCTQLDAQHQHQVERVSHVIKGNVGESMSVFAGIAGDCAS